MVTGKWLYRHPIFEVTLPPKKCTRWGFPLVLDRVTVLISYMDVSENSGTPKWMVYNGKPY